MLGFHNNNDVWGEMNAGGETLPASQDESKELASVHTGHSTGHLPAPETDQCEVRRENARLE